MPKTLQQIYEKAESRVPSGWEFSKFDTNIMKKITALIKIWKDPAGNGDDVFKASNMKRDPEKRFYPGDDVAAYNDWNKS